MSTNEIPPWVEAEDHEQLAEANVAVCDSRGYVTQSQLAAVLAMLKSQRALIDTLSKQLACFINNAPDRPAPESDVRHRDGKLAKGKYAGRSHAWVLANAPDYIVYLARNNWSDSWGFTQEQVDQAYANMKDDGK